jgi:hypothetical protein
LGLAGFLGATAALTKTSMSFNLGILFLFLIWLGSHKLLDWSFVRRAMTAMAAGAVVTLFVIVSPWIITGHLGDFWFANVVFNLEYSGMGGQTRLFLLILQLGKPLLGACPLWLLAIAGTSARVLPINERILLRVWALGSLIGVCWTGLFLPYYYVHLLPAAALLVAVAIEHLAVGWHRPQTRLIVSGILIPLTVLMLVTLSKPYLAANANARHEQKWNTAPAKRDVLSPQLAKRIRELTPCGGPIYVLGSQSQLYPLSRRQPAARVHRLSWLVVDPSLVIEVIEQLNGSHPDLFLDVSRDIDPYLPDPLSADLRAKFDEFLGSQYRLVQSLPFGERWARFYLRN